MMISAADLLKAEIHSAALQLPREEQTWAGEVRRRVEAFRAGRARTRPIDEVLDEVDALLR